MKHLHLFTAIIIMAALFTTNLFGQEKQTTISGSIVEMSTGENVIGANVYLEGTTVGTVSDLHGKFKFTTVLSGKQTLTISSVGMTTITKELELTGKEIKLGKVKQENDAVGLVEVMVFADVAIDRHTPVAVSNIKPERIEAKLGAQEFPEILKSTPGVYATKQGGAFGDSRVNIRGFNSRYVAVMINGMPVNDMESGWVYWSNWAGLADVTRSMQVQRGLGAAKVALPSVGGTINILTKTTDTEKGGSVYAATGNNNYNKIGLTLSSGLTEKNWATSFSLSKSSSDGYVDATQYEAYSYFFNISKIINDKHRMAFSVFGAPQEHGQRSSRLPIATYTDPTIRSTKYNSDWGYKNGEVYNLRRNYYHKPQGILNHFWKVNDRLNVSTAAYVSLGTGGGTSPHKYRSLKGEPRVSNRFYGNDAFRTENLIDFDRTVEENIARGDSGSANIVRSSINNHFWTGILPQVKYDMGWVKLSGGVDLRYYKGIHYREVTDLLGGEHFIDRSDRNNPTRKTHLEDKVAFYNDGLVGWYGLFGQAEVSYGNVSAFVASSVSFKSYKRIDYFNYFTDATANLVKSDPNVYNAYLNDLGEKDFNTALENDIESDWINYTGYSIKGGANYNLSENHNVFFNAGYFENPPDFRTVFSKHTNEANREAPNEKLSSLELGYGFRSGIFSANVNAYYTLWKDKARVISKNVDGVNHFVNLTGINATHKGIEFDLLAKPTKKLSIRGMLSIGDWRWANDLKDVRFFDNNQVEIAKASIYVKDVHVGDAAQNTAAVSLDYEFMKGVSLGADYNFYDNIYAEFDPAWRTKEPEFEQGNPDSWKMPSYQLVDLNVRYKFELGSYKATLIGNINNLFDETYISDARDGRQNDANSAEVFYGWGRSWRMALKLYF